MRYTILGVLVMVFGIAVTLTLLLADGRQKQGVSFEAFGTASNRLLDTWRLQSELDAAMGAFASNQTGDLTDAWSPLETAQTRAERAMNILTLTSRLHQRHLALTEKLMILHGVAFDHENGDEVPITETVTGLDTVQAGTVRSEVVPYLIDQAERTARALKAGNARAARVGLLNAMINLPNISDHASKTATCLISDFDLVVEANRMLLLVFFGVGFVVVVISSGSVLVTSTLRLRRQTTDTMLIFLHIPRHVLKKLRELASMRYEAALVSALDDAEEAAEGDGESTAGGGAGGSIQGGAARNASSAGDAQGVGAGSV